MQTLGHRVKYWGKVQPNKIAVNDGTLAYTYQQLSERAQSYACQLASMNVTPGDRVMIMLPKGAETICAILGTLLLGATYIPIDTGSPKKRLHNIAQDSQAKVAIVDQHTSGWFDEFSELNTDAISETVYEDSCDNFDLGINAYVLYTSGSTGQPNGVCISYKAMHSFFESVNCFMGISRTSRCMNTSALYFDVSVVDTMLPLYQGASVWLGPNIPLPFRFIDIIASEKITHFCAVGSTLTMLSASPDFKHYRWPHIQRIMTGAEVLNPNSVNAWLEVASNTRVINGYGPTEATCVCTVYDIQHTHTPHRNSYPIGVALPNVEILIDNPDDKGAGELCVAGPQVMNGYLNRPLLNRDRLFERSGKRYYRTGDKVGLNEDGHLLFLGRIDDQVKVNGYRIHLGEVAEPFRNFEGVQEAVALSLKHPKLGECLAVVVQPGDDFTLTIDTLKHQCNEALPTYMRPALIAQMSTLPLNPSGKVNVKKVRAMATDHLIHKEEEASVIECVKKEAIA